jgi:hypothetical protein
MDRLDRFQADEDGAVDRRAGGRENAGDREGIGVVLDKADLEPMPWATTISSPTL